MKKNRNSKYAIVKLLFVCLIIIMHCNIYNKNGNVFLEGAYLFCDFFFIFSGYFLSKNVIVQGGGKR